MNKSNILVTRPSLPPLDEYVASLKEIWDSGWLTNGGPKHQLLEHALARYLGVNQVCLFNNGTIALLVALQALRISGEVITTPYSFVATSHALLWNGITPVFVDIDERTLNMDPGRIEPAVTQKTAAILPVHCYGNPCDTSGIRRIADNYNLRTIYDAAHAFGVEDKDGSILKHGDLSVLSFHATKVFNTFEGGAIICHDEKTKGYIDKLKNFGFVDEVTVSAVGINGKMSEVNAALGLLQLKYVDDAIEKRRSVAQRYHERLVGIAGIRCLDGSGQTRSNYSYFPVLVGPEFRLSRDALYDRLKKNGIFARRYFYPLISTFPMYRNLPSAQPSNLPVATRMAEQVICLPMYAELELETVDRICDVIVGESA